MFQVNLLNLLLLVVIIITFLEKLCGPLKYINVFNYFIFHLLIAEHIFFLKKSRCTSECFMRQHICIAFYVYVFIHAYM